METVPERYDPDEPVLPDYDSPEGMEREALAEFADCMKAMANNLASIAHSLFELLELQRAKAAKPKAIKVLPDVPVPAELTYLKLYQADKKLCAKWPELLPVWKQAYPGLNILAEVSRAHAWEIANPTKAKKDRIRFLTAWMAREQDRGRGPVRGAPPAQKTEEERRRDDEQMNRYLEGKFGGQG